MRARGIVAVFSTALLVLCAACSRGDAPTAPSSLGTPPASHGSGASVRGGGPSSSTDRERYVASVQESRRRKDDFFRSSEQSPVPPEQRVHFAPLDYYPVDPTWRLTLAVERYDDPRTLTLVTNMGEERVFRREGQVRFVREGATVTLQLYREVESTGASRTLWLPFADAGAGRETYPGGRYLDVEMGADGSVVLDFNEAYNPYCAYGWAYSCPMTPPENRLKVSVRAGERGFHAPQTLSPRGNQGQR